AAVALELVGDDGIAVLVIQAAARTKERRIGRAAGARRARVGERDEDDPPGLVVGESVMDDRVVAAAGDGYAGPHRARASRARVRDIGHVVVMDVVVHEYPAAHRTLHGRLLALDAGAVLRRRVVAVLAVGVKAVLVVVELGVLDHQIATRVRP